MCGIFGYFDLRGHKVSHDVLAEMGNLIRHRGPDGQGIYDDDELSVSIGNQRLAILDIENGQQPFISDDGNIIVVQNGEIFNHIELAALADSAGFPCKTHCDTEVLLRLYEMEGISFIERLNGMFSIAVYDKREHSLYIIRDRVGEKPLYYSNDGDRLIFASEIKAMLPLTTSISVDYAALEQYMTLNYVPMPLTLFEGIYHVKPGHYLHFSADGLEERCWWDLAKVKAIYKSEDDWILEFNNVLDDAVRLRLRSDVDFGAFLSGGVDSSTIVGLMSRHMSTPVKTYSIGFNDPRYDESIYAEQAARRFSTDHVMKKVESNLLSLWPLATYYSDQPHGDVSFLPTYKVAELAAKDVKMVLTGDGADELFAGYDKYKDFFTKVDVSSLSEEDFAYLYADNISLFDDVSRGLLFSDIVKGKIKNNKVGYSIIKPHLDKVNHMDRINQALYIDTQLLLSGNNLVKPDRMGMAVSIENRAPFLDYRIIELAFSMPGSLKLHEGETKYIYKKAVRSLIGDDLAYRKKQMFTVPVGEWFKSELLPMCKELLVGKKARERGFFDYGYIDSILDKHSSGEKNYTREIRALIAFEYWCREFLD